ncbi:Sporulation kinase E [Candidatus Brocadiaceae bacterium B188]|nr:PAS domain S-box protein [Candidatus Brocadia sapporoensis]QQR65990.1 MAG: PAS domain S-box protein [Candidatus Brocadia sp.]RZV56455.1 MAG: PAS domain S-box protein [Candidatus Brocadia sp. BROELEC01]TWU50350.1 Sporulation kinase E [Candidatus Brocadiaceae bacterium B188]
MKRFVRFFKSIKVKLICYFILMTALPIMIISNTAYNRGKRALNDRVIEKLTSIAELKKAQLSNWLQERLIDIGVLSTNKSLEVSFSNLLYLRKAFRSVGKMKESEIGEVYYKRLSEYLNKLKEKFVYCNEISMLDIENGEIMMSTTESNIGLIDEDYPYCLDVLGRNDLPFKDIHYSKYTKQIGMTLFGTLKKTDPVTMEETDVVNGIVIIRINTNNAIGSLLQDWPGSGETGETLLVRRTGDQLLFLNNTRHLADTSLKVSIPVNSITPESFMLDAGEEGIIKAIDHRGIEVLLAFRYIPQLKWGLIVKQDTSEAFKSITELKNQVITLAIVSEFIIVIIIFILAHGITHPISRLVQGAHAIGKGNLEYRIAINSEDEVGVLASEFNKMAEKLEGSYAGLEQKIRERTAQLRESEERYRESINLANDAIFTLDVDSAQIIDLNKKAEELSGCLKNEFHDKKIWEIVPEYDREKTRQLWLTINEAGSGMLDNVDCQHVDGRLTPTSISASVIEYGKRKSIQWICRDITERKRMELQLIQTERLAAVGELAAGVAHEVNNPLGGLQNFVKMMKKEPENVLQNREFLDLMSEGLKRIEIIVKQLMTFSRPYSTHMSNHRLNEIVENSLRFVDHRIKESGVHLKKELSLDLPEIYGDADNISQVLINIIVNALDSISKDGNLTIKTGYCDFHPSSIQVAITDTGSGIPEEILNKIFNPFFTTKEMGSGLGLAISKRIVDDHNGNIVVKSNPGEGTTFYVCLPVRKITVTT